MSETVKEFGSEFMPEGLAIDIQAVLDGADAGHFTRLLLSLAMLSSYLEQDDKINERSIAAIKNDADCDKDKAEDRLVDRLVADVQLNKQLHDLIYDKIHSTHRFAWNEFVDEKRKKEEKK